MPLPPSSSSQRSPTKMLERVLSSRRYAPYADESSAENDAVADESKTKKHLPISFFTTRITNYLTRTGPVWPCLLVLALVLLLIFSLIFNSRRFVCVSPYDPVSRTGFFGFDGLESDFGSLGVPWCRSKHGKAVEWTTKDLIKGLEMFVPIYETRPIKNNMYGDNYQKNQKFPTTMATNGAPTSTVPKPVVTDEVQKVFKNFDANGDGKISVNELGNDLKALGSNVSGDKLKRVMVDLDTDNDGFICLDEFNSFWVAGSKDGGAAELKDAFDLYDQDRNGLISTNELHLVLSRLNLACTVEDCNRMIKSVDADGDGNVNFEEFKKMMGHSVSTN